MSTKIRIPPIALLLLMSLSAHAQTPSSDRSGFSLSVLGGASIPLGQGFDTRPAAELPYEMGFFTELSAEYGLPIPLSFHLNVGYSAAPMVAGPRVDMGLVELGAGWTFPIGDLFALKARLGGGGSIGVLSDAGSAGIPTPGACASADAVFQFRPLRNLSFDLGVRYRVFFGVLDGLFAGLTASYRFDPPSARPAYPEG